MNTDLNNPKYGDLEKYAMLQVNCSCGQELYIFFEGKTHLTDHVTICKKCGKKIFWLNCRNEKCQTGFGFSESSKELNLEERKWKCPQCKRENQLDDGLEKRLISSFTQEEIPDDVWKGQMPPMTLRAKLGTIIILVIVALVFLYVFLEKYF